MSQMTSTARVGARALNRPTTQTPRLRVVTGAPLRRGGAVFGIICATLLAMGLLGLLVLNTALAQGSFTLHDLRATSDQLTDTEGALNQSLDVSKSPANLAMRAAGMGMVPAESAAFLRLSDGTVIGVATPATADHRLTVVGAQGAPRTPVVAQQTKKVPVAAKTATAAPAPAATRPATPVSVAVRAPKPAKR